MDWFSIEHDKREVHIENDYLLQLAMLNAKEGIDYSVFMKDEFAGTAIRRGATKRLNGSQQIDIEFKPDQPINYVRIDFKLD